MTIHNHDPSVHKHDPSVHKHDPSVHGHSSSINNHLATAPTPPVVLPPNMAELAFWVDGFDIDLSANSTLVDLGLLDVWKQKGNVADDIVQAAGGAQPYYAAAGINGHPAVQFGFADSLAGSVSAVPLQAARHIFFVLDVPASNNQFFSPCGTLSGAYCLYAGASDVYIESNLQTTNNTINIATPMGPSILEWSFDGVTTNRPTFVVNGVSRVVSNGAGSGVGSENAAPGTVLGSATFDAPVGEILSYSAVQSPANVLLIRALLSTKWGIAV